MSYQTALFSQTAILSVKKILPVICFGIFNIKGIYVFAGHSSIFKHTVDLSHQSGTFSFFSVSINQPEVA